MQNFLLQIQNPAARPGTGDFTTHSLEIIAICLGMFLLGWFLHHLIFSLKRKARTFELEGNLVSARTRITDLEDDLEGCTSATVINTGEYAALSTNLNRREVF